MSGILCVYNEAGVARELPRYRAGLQRLAHRGSDGEGIESRDRLFLGARWSSEPRSDLAQPLVHVEGGLVAALDGRLHNRTELVDRLAASGCRADISSDLGIVLEAYAVWGDRCFEWIRGVWAFVLWDEHNHRVVGVRDPLGVRPLYVYTEGTELLVIASEIKGILAVAPDAREVHQQRVRDFVCEGRIDDWAATLFSRIQPVAPGTVMSFDAGRIGTRRYRSLRPITDPAASLSGVRERLVDAVARHVPPDVPIGLALSGGIDSSSLAGALTHTTLRGTRQIQAFSIQPPNTAAESQLIDATIRHTGLPHTYASLDELDYAQSLARLIDFHDEPIHSSGFFYQFLLRETIARAGCKAVLVGYGADEIFGGYPHLAEPFLVALAADGQGRELVRFLWGAAESSLARMVVASMVRRAKALLVQRSERISTWDLQRTGSDVLAHDYGREEWARPRDSAVLERDGLEGGRIFFNALLGEFRANISLLVRVEDRDAAAHGLELCVPFMDEDLVLLALSFPFQRYMAGGRNKAILRDAAAGLLAPEVRSYGRKMGTPGNDAHLVFDVLRPALNDLLSSECFYNTGVWSPRCSELYQADARRGARARLWFRVYMVHEWYQRIVRSFDGSA